MVTAERGFRQPTAVVYVTQFSRRVGLALAFRPCGGPIGDRDEDVSRGPSAVAHLLVASLQSASFRY